MIAECAADLVARVVTVPALATRAAFALGGHGADPGLTTIPLPAAWIIFANDLVDEPPFGHATGHRPGNVPGMEKVLATFWVVIYVDYIDQADLFAVQFPLLEAVINAVKANSGQAPSGFRWRYIGQKLALVSPDRLAYQQHYTLEWPVGSSFS